jgi:phage terminase large subunit-like protein
VRLGRTEIEALDRHWPGWAHEGQRPPDVRPDGKGWRIWVLMAGRNFGKTLAGAQWVRTAVEAHDAGGKLRIALVAATLDEARRVMVEGETGLLEVADTLIAEWNPTLRTLRFKGGAEATLFSGASPDQLRGPQHHLAWCDELAKWEKPKETWDMLQLGLRLGDHPRALVTTTPRPGPVLTAIIADKRTVLTRGRTEANPHLSDAWLEAMRDLYAGTRLERQELDGELLTDSPGALWSVELLEKCRRIRDESTTFIRVVIGVDPPSGEGTCGIVACAKDAQGRAHVLADHSVTGRTPEGWARAVAAAAEAHASLVPSLSRGVEVVAESNQGGRMVESVLHAASANLKVKRVHASEGKTARADPIATLFEAGKVTLHGRFPELEAQLCGMIGGGGYEGPGASPDRADAMVWALTELMLGRERGEPSVRRL